MDEQFPQSTTLRKEQKAGFALLLLFGVLAVGLGVLQMRNTIYGPFAYKAPAQAAYTTDDLLDEEMVRLQSVDTDHDGLNDYEELYFYQTSPYIPDTDSDGISDKDELDSGGDPNCPKGQNCSDTTEYADGNTSSTVTEFGVTPSVASPVDILGQVNTDISQGKETDLSQVVGDVDTIRHMLLQTGKLSKEQLDALDDQTILNLVVQILAEEDGGTAIAPGYAASSTTSSPQLP